MPEAADTLQEEVQKEVPAADVFHVKPEGRYPGHNWAF